MRERCSRQCPFPGSYLPRSFISETFPYSGFGINGCSKSRRREASKLDDAVLYTLLYPQDSLPSRPAPRIHSLSHLSCTCFGCGRDTWEKWHQTFTCDQRNPFGSSVARCLFPQCRSSGEKSKERNVLVDLVKNLQARLNYQFIKDTKPHSLASILSCLSFLPSDLVNACFCYICCLFHFGSTQWCNYYPAKRCLPALPHPH